MDNDGIKPIDIAMGKGKNEKILKRSDSRI